MECLKLTWVQNQPNLTHPIDGTQIIIEIMKTNPIVRRLALAVLLLAFGNSLSHTALAQGTAFTYQGRLNTASGPANGSYDLTFTLLNASASGSAVGGSITNTGASVSNGLFTVTLDFGGTPYLSGAPIWLEIAARTNGAASFSPPLTPRQAVLSTPYASYAYSVNASSLIGQVTDANLSATFNSPHAFNNPGSSFTGNGSGLTSLNAASLSSGIMADARLSANVALLNANQTFTGSNNFGGGVGVPGTNTIHFGAGLAGQEPNAGKIGYELFTKDALDNVGAGTNTTRKIKFWAGGGATFEAGASFSGALGLWSPSTTNGTMLLNSNNGAGNQQLWIMEQARSAASPTNIVVRITPWNSEGVGYIDAISTDLSSPTNLLINPLGGNVGIGAVSPQYNLSVGNGMNVDQNGLNIGNVQSNALVFGPDSFEGIASKRTSGGTQYDSEFYTFGANRLEILHNGNVGIGTTAPNELLELGNGRAFIGDGGGAARKGLIIQGNTGNYGRIEAFNYGSFTGLPLTLNNLGHGFVGIGTTTPANTLDMQGSADFTGNVGIGTTTPTKASLEIDTQNGSLPSYGSGGTLVDTGAGHGFVTAGNPASIWAFGGIVANGFFAFSDARIKNILGRSDSSFDLRTLLGIEVTDYTYKDMVAKGNRPRKKVIAQQVEKVFPQAVSQSTNEVPDIYKQATVQDGWVELATDLQAGDHVKLITDQEQGVHEVLEIRDGAFRTDFDRLAYNCGRRRHQHQCSILPQRHHRAAGCGCTFHGRGLFVDRWLLESF